MDRKNSFSFLTAAYNSRKKSTRGDLRTLKVMGRAVSMEGVAEFWGHIVTRPPRAEMERVKRHRQCRGIRYQSGCGPRWHPAIICPDEDGKPPYWQTYLGGPSRAMY